MSGNPGAEYSQLSGNRVWLGGFRNLVNGKNHDGVITLGANLDMRNHDRLLDDYLSETEQALLDEKLGYYPDYGSDSWGFQLQIAWDPLINRPYIRQYECYGNGELFFRIEKKSSAPESSITHFKLLEHLEMPEPLEAILQTDFNTSSIGLSKQHHALPNIYKRLDLSAAPWDWESLYEESPLAAKTFCEAALSQSTLAPLKEFSRLLRTLLHIGPLRVIPDASMHILAGPENSRWYDGKGAWDVFVNGSSTFRNKVNAPFLDEDKFATSYQFVESRPEQVDHRFVYVDNQDLGIRHQLTELGVGVSQVFPVVAGICLEQDVILSCEQPELHIHPRWQLVLADMMLESIKDHYQKLFLMETHSEHLMLRLLRRRRETAEQVVESPELECRPEDVQIVFCEQVNGETRLRGIATTDEGEFDAPWPNGFFKERRGELF